MKTQRRRALHGTHDLALLLSVVVLVVGVIALGGLGGSRPAVHANYLASPFALADTRGVAFFRSLTDTSTSALTTVLQGDITSMQAVGFNTVRLVSNWNNFEPIALPSPSYNAQSFTNLRATLALLSANHLRAVLGLNYLGATWGAPTGISSCAYMTDPTQWAAFVAYVNMFLGQITDYASTVSILIFAETAVPCNITNTYNQAAQMASELAPTIGNLPAQLDPAARSLFQIGYQDNAMISLGWSGSTSPLTSPLSYDFLAMDFYNPQLPDGDAVPDAYDTGGCTLSVITACVQDKLTKRAARFASRWPGVPLVVSEGGATYCDANNQPTQQQSQATIVQAMASVIRTSGYGFTYWGYEPGPANLDCAPSGGYGGKALTNQDGTLNAAGLALETIGGAPPIISDMGVTTSFSPWVIWVHATNLAPGVIVARLTDVSGASWGGDLPVTYGASFSNFHLPANAPPSNCNAVQSCTIHVVLFDTASGLSSQSAALVLPVHG